MVLFLPFPPYQIPSLFTLVSEICLVSLLLFLRKLIKRTVCSFFSSSLTVIRLSYLSRNVALVQDSGAANPIVSLSTQSLLNLLTLSHFSLLPELLPPLGIRVIILSWFFFLHRPLCLSFLCAFLQISQTWSRPEYPCSPS